MITIRRNKLPDPQFEPNVGSFFKNPIISKGRLNSILSKNRDEKGLPHTQIDNDRVKISAAWLIDKCGYKKINDENVGVYKNQPLVLINLGNASGNEIINFAKRIKDSVFNEFDIELEEEVIIM